MDNWDKGSCRQIVVLSRVRPSPEFTLEQGPVSGGIWLPTSFDEEVRASALFFWSHNLSDQQTYWDYQWQLQPLSGAARARLGTVTKQ